MLLLAGCRPASSPALRLALLGDVMLGRGVDSRLHSCPQPFAYLSPALRAVDLAAANLESPLTARPLLSSGYDLRADPMQVEFLASSGLSLLNVANNHSGDAGPSGLADTRTALQSAGVQAVGSGPQALVWSHAGRRLAFLAFDDVSAPLDLEAAAHQVSTARLGGAPVVVSIHWGGEFQPAPSPRQQQIAQALADAGADLIWGHHPHVLQPVAWVPGAGRPHPTLVAYSLGNALFDQVMLPDVQRGALLIVSLGPGGVEVVQAQPFKIDLARGCITIPSQAEAQAVFRRLGSIVQPYLPSP